MERTVAVNGVELHVVDEGPGPSGRQSGEHRPPVILAHGFPELAYSWRHQIPFLAANGYRVLASDQRGYGRSSRPEAISDYDIHHLTGDLIALLDDIGEEKAVFVGHDWGSQVVWQLSLLHPDRVAAVCGMSVPFIPRGPVPPTAAMRNVFGDSFFYILYFQEPGVADANLGADPRRTMTGMLAGMSGGTIPEVGPDAGFAERLPIPETLPAWLSQAELDVYVEEFTRTGFTGGINWYRNFDRNWETTPQLDGAHVTVPSLFIGGSADPVLLMSPPTVGEAFLDDHRGTVLIDGAGHWVQQEKPDEVNAALLELLRGL